MQLILDLARGPVDGPGNVAADRQARQRFYTRGEVRCAPAHEAVFDSDGGPRCADRGVCPSWQGFRRIALQPDYSGRAACAGDIAGAPPSVWRIVIKPEGVVAWNGKAIEFFMARAAALTTAPVDPYCERTLQQLLQPRTVILGL